MDDTDLPRFAAAWVMTVRTATGKTPDDDVVRFVFTVLRRFSIEQVEQALHAHLQHPDRGMYAPKPADVVRAIEGGVEAHEAMATNAWVKFVQATRNCGQWTSVVFDDAQIHRVVQAMGGWQRLVGGLLESELKWKQREFEKLYLSIPRTGQYQPVLIGLEDATNMQGGHQNEPVPALLGDREQAQAVLEGGRAALEGPRHIGALGHKP